MRKVKVWIIRNGFIRSFVYNNHLSKLFIFDFTYKLFIYFEESGIWTSTKQ